MPPITAEIVKKLDNKVRCLCCKRILFEGVIERGCINIQCPSCGTDNVYFVAGVQKDRFVNSGRSMVDMIKNTVK